MNWEAKVAKVSRKGNRSVATVELAAPGRYPSPGWWQNVEAYQNTSLVAGQPPATVVIAKQTFRLAAVPSGDGTRLEVDVSHAKPRVKAGDPVCLLCSAHTLQDMSQVSVSILEGVGWPGVVPGRGWVDEVMPRRAVLRCVLCCAVPCCVLPWHAALWCTVHTASSTNVFFQLPHPHMLPVCLLPGSLLQETGADDYNVALAVAGHKPVEGTEVRRQELAGCLQRGIALGGGRPLASLAHPHLLQPAEHQPLAVSRILPPHEPAPPQYEEPALVSR